MRHLSPRGYDYRGYGQTRFTEGWDPLLSDGGDTLVHVMAEQTTSDPSARESAWLLPSF